MYNYVIMYEYIAKVERVIDGDTIDVFLDLGFHMWHKERLRLFGIDTPEKNTPYGKFVKSWLVEKIEGKEIRISVTNKDKYGRYLAVIFMPNMTTSINDELINNNMAKAYLGSSKLNLWTKEELSKTS